MFFLLRVMSVLTTAASFASPAALPSRLGHHLLKLLPLLRGQNLLETLVGLPSDFVEARLRLLAQRAHAFACVGEYLAHLRLLLVGEFEPFDDLLEAVAA